MGEHDPRDVPPHTYVHDEGAFMGGFQILSEASRGLLRHVDTAVRTKVVDDVARAVVSTRTSVTNPLYVLSDGALSTGIFRPAIYERATQSVIRGTGASGFDDAVMALGRLGDQHGITGISLSTDPALTGTLNRAGTGYFTNHGFAPDVARSIDDAARRVLSFVKPST